MKFLQSGFFKICLVLTGLFTFYGQSQAQGLPEGEHRDKVIFACSACHGLDNIFNASNKMSAKDWSFTSMRWFPGVHR